MLEAEDELIVDLYFENSLSWFERFHVIIIKMRNFSVMAKI